MNSSRHVAKARRGDIQGLRAVAVLLVVVYHSGVGLPGGFVGVDVFFVISGYVITKMLATELNGGHNHVDLKRFYLRRVRRLLPALGLMLSVVTLTSVLFASIGGQKLTARTGAAAALLNANTYLMRAGESGYFDVSSNLNALLHTWSLSVEEQFYLVFPALLLAAWTLGRRRGMVGSARVAISMLVAIAALSFALSFVTTNGQFGPLPIGDFVEEFAFYSSMTRAWEFALGGLLAFSSSRIAALGVVFSSAAAATGLLLIAFASFSFDEQTPFPGSAALIPVAGTILILAAGESRAGNLLNQLLAVRPAQFIGDLSYSWYLWHWPSIVFAAALWPSAAQSGPIAAALSLVPAWLSYRFVENPIRFAPVARAGRTVALASACILLPLGSAVVLETGSRVLQTNNAVVAFHNALRHHADFAMGCDNATALGARDNEQCTWTVENPVGTAFLVGDSNAGHFSEAFVGAANADAMDATIATMSACPFIDLIVFRNGVTDPDCATFVSATVQHLLDLRPTVVFIASSSDRWIEFDEVALQVPGFPETLSTPNEKAIAWEDGLVRTIGPLTAAGIDVVVVHPAPKMRNWDPRNCAVLRVLSSQAACGTSIPRADADRYRARAVSAETTAVGRTSARALDVIDHLCPTETCTALQDGTWIWRDSNHISVEASITLIPLFRSLL